MFIFFVLKFNIFPCLFLAASKGNYFQGTPEQDVRGHEEPWEITITGEHCSSTEFSSVAEI